MLLSSTRSRSNSLFRNLFQQKKTEQQARLEEERKKVASSGMTKANAFKEAELKAKAEKDRKLQEMMDKMVRFIFFYPFHFLKRLTCVCFLEE